MSCEPSESRTPVACPESLARTSRIAAGNRCRGGSRCSLKGPNTRPSKANIFSVDAVVLEFAELWTADVNKGGLEHLCAGCRRGTECSVRSESVQLRLAGDFLPMTSRARECDPGEYKHASAAARDGKSGSDLNHPQPQTIRA
jgi:hypothetical protein